MLKLIKRIKRPCWYLRGTVRGISIFESTGIAIENKKAAEELKARRESELLEESIHGKRAVITFAQAALSYVEAGGEQTYLRPIERHLGTMKLGAIGQADIDEVARKLSPASKPSTIKRRVYTPVSAVFNHAMRRGWCNKLVLDWPKEDEPRIRWLTHEEAERLISASGPVLRPLVIFLLYTGARIGEALWLDWKDVALDRRHVQFIDTKNGTSRGVPLHHRVVTELKAMTHSTGCVFLNHYGRPYKMTNPQLAGTVIQYQFRSAVKRAGLTDFHPHDCRHTWATWHYQANRDLGALQKLGGWKTLSMVMRYAHTNVAELDHTISRLR